MSDQSIRAQTTNLGSNILLGAGAGMGKTFELVKRLLKCLTVVDKPNQVLPVTFTVKARAEMKERVLSELYKAQKNEPLQSPHEAEMRTLAKAVLKRDAELGWGMLKNTNVLDIKTFDSLSASILSMAPVTSKIGAQTKVLDNPSTVYRKASERLLSDYSTGKDWAGHVKMLLKHLDNNFEKATAMLCEMLAVRDQWLPLVLEINHVDNVKPLLERNNLVLVNVMYQSFISVVMPLEQEIIQMFQYVSKNADSALHEKLGPLYEINELPSDITSEHDLDVYSSLIRFLTTSKGDGFIKALNKGKGFPAASSIKDKELKGIATLEKENGMYVLTEIASAGLDMWLSGMHKTTTYKYEEQEWGILEVLVSVLPILASNLLLEFKNINQVDFIEVSGGALAALGEIDNPTNLALRLDKQYKHILVDECQDCNFSQIELLSRLTAGWERGDGRSLFFVGDPKQSIYLFRGSNVTLFMLIAQNGLNDLEFVPLQLKNNFRSQANLVKWVNNTFECAFGNTSDLSVGMIPYEKAAPTKAPSLINESPVDIEIFDRNGGGRAEAEYICQKVDEISKFDPGASIAVLAKSRSLLNNLTELMNENSLGHKAHNIHKLESNPVIINLIALTRAILHSSDRVAWLSLLRSPFVGLSVGDMEKVAMGEKGYVYGNSLLVNLITSDTVLASIDEEFSTKLKRLSRVMKQSTGHLERKSLTTIVRGAFYELGGLSTAHSEIDMQNIEAFFNLLSRFDYDTFNLETFEHELSSLYAMNQDDKTNVILMTIHGSKGLEFDYVFIPGAHSRLRSDVPKMLETETVNVDGAHPVSVIAPVSESGDASLKINSVINSFTTIKKNLEATRLAYVAVTRAKKKLYITGEAKEAGNKGQFVNTSLLSTISSSIPDDFNLRDGAYVEVKEEGLNRDVLSNVIAMPLPEGNSLAQYRGLINVSNEVLPNFNWVKDISRSVGIVIHLALEEMAVCGVDQYYAEGLDKFKSKYHTQLKQEGVAKELLTTGVNLVVNKLNKLRNDETLDWLLYPRETMTTEMEFTTVEAGKLKQRRVDLTFIEHNMRYFFDYKSDEPAEGESTQSFVARMMAAYKGQMKIYENCFQADECVRGGLFLLAINTIAWLDNINEKAS